MTLNAKIGVLWIFWRFRAERHISGANCAEINWDRHGEAAYEIFSIQRRFRRSKSRFSRFKETCARGHQRAVPPVKVVILPLLASLSWKQLETDWQFANRNCYRLSRVSWALAQISCFFLQLMHYKGLKLLTFLLIHLLTYWLNTINSRNKLAQHCKKQTQQQLQQRTECAVYLNNEFRQRLGDSAQYVAVGDWHALFQVETRQQKARQVIQVTCHRRKTIRQINFSKTTRLFKNAQITSHHLLSCLYVVYRTIQH